MAIQLPVLKQRSPLSPPDGGSAPRSAHGNGHDLRGGAGASKTQAAQTLKVGELARLSGKTVRALHLYEERGLLEPIERSKGGFRLYAEDALLRVRWISKLQDMGFSLTDIQTMLRQWEKSGSAPDAMLHVGELLREKLKETREQITRLSALEEELRSSLSYLQTCPSCSPNQIVSACNSCELHDENEVAPDLVAGFRAHEIPNRTPAAGQKQSS